MDIGGTKRMWAKLKSLITGPDRDAFREDLSNLLKEGSQIDLRALIALHRLSIVNAEVDVRFAIRDALLDDWQSRAERLGLNIEREATRLADLGLGKNFSKSVIEEFGKNRLDWIIQDILADGQIDPSEDARLYGEAEALGLPIPETAEISEARELWHIFTQPMPILDPPLLLKKGELCHQACKASAFEDRLRTVRVGYSGTRARVKIMKGVYYSVGSARITAQKEEYSHKIGGGVLCSTSTRLLFVSPAKTISIPLGKILQYETYSDGIKIFKDTGKPITFQFDRVSKPDVIRVVRVIEECR
ncbi:hypothetical protein [Novosphingobium lentum]|uniref:hypothetical protein n=1 Tax=Novosphingobium lentum TaxID=145287 RepID=UPI000AF7B393|nr:hypothetical protein [Novosphingobium lentum]